MILSKKNSIPKENAAHKPYLGPYGVEKQDGISVWLYKEGDPTVRKEVKISEIAIFAFKTSISKIFEETLVFLLIIC